MKSNREKGKLFGIVILLLCMLLFLHRLTGAVCHVVLGMLLVVMIVVHVCRQICKLKYKSRAIQLVDKVLLLALAVTIVSGILLHPLQGVLAIKILHKLSSLLLVGGTIMHVVQHKARKQMDGKE